jgi:hypothetical protein
MFINEFDIFALIFYTFVLHACTQGRVEQF